MTSSIKLSSQELETLKQAYDVLTRIGNETAIDGGWDHWIDRAHHYLALVMVEASK